MRPTACYAYKTLFQVRSPPPCLQLFLPVFGYSCPSGKKIADPERTTQALQNNSQRTEDDLNDTISSLRAQNQTLRTELTDSRQKADRLTKILSVHRQKYICESLYADGRVTDAAQSLLEIMRTATDDVKADATVMDWISGEFRHYGPDEAVQSLLSVFRCKCIVALESIGDEASKAQNRDEGLGAYSIALSLSPPSSNGLLSKWARLMLLHGSPNETLDAATKVCFTNHILITDPDVVFVWLSSCFQCSPFTLQFTIFLKWMVASRKRSVCFRISSMSLLRPCGLRTRKVNGN